MRLAALLAHDVETLVPRVQWDARFAEEDMPADPTAPRCAMPDGFDSGWVDFEGGASEHIHDRIRLGCVVNELVSARSRVLESTA
jgi:NAD(P)H dehydrogenase (quinone)